MCLSGCLLANDINSKAYINMTKSRWTIIQSSPASNPWSIPFISLECLLFWNGMSFLPVGLSSAFAKMMTRCDLRDLNTTFLSSKLCGEKSLLGRQIRRWLVGYRRNIYTDETYKQGVERVNKLCCLCESQRGRRYWVEVELYSKVSVVQQLSNIEFYQQVSPNHPGNMMV